MTDAVTLTTAAIKKALAPQTGSAVVAIGLTQIDWWSFSIAVAVAGAVALIAASDKYSESHDVPSVRMWVTEFGIGAAAGLFVWFLVDMAQWDYRGQLAAIAASGWSGRWALDAGKELLKRVLSGGSS